MSEYFQSRLVVLCILLSATACRRSVTAPAAAPQNTNDVAIQATEDITVGTLDVELSSTYEESSEDAADAVLVVSLNTPAIQEGNYRFPLKKNANPGFPGTNFQAQCVCADGFSKDGHGIGYVLNITLSGTSATHITATVDVSGTDKELRPFEVKEELQVPWLGRAEKSLANGGQILAAFEPRGKSKTPPDNNVRTKLPLAPRDARR